ncbi:uncharacterized protein LOC116126970 [Pistacia vera]|uniref:uncharacterized protein LOC116126970 n=1 Tax=Pistacia vera TaxID=55513 RepID=UPI0012632874|nr:uncharacterized protein LOC116126970 [Pistacia vera]
MACETAKKAWDKLREEFTGSDTTRNMQVMNLRKEFEMLRMQEVEKVKEYVDRLMRMVNKIGLLGVEMSDKVIVEKVLVSLPERFESKISSLEDSKDLSQINLTELVHALQVQEPRRLMRQEDANEGAMMAAQKGRNVQGNNRRYAGDKKGKEKTSGQWGKPSGTRSYPPCPHYKKKGHSENRYWFRPGIQCRVCKQFGHIEKVCKNKSTQPPQQAQSAEDQQHGSESEQLFVASCYIVQTSSEVCLIDSGCTNHMAANLQNFIRMACVYFLKQKNEVVDIFRKFKLLVENQAGTMIKAIRSDNRTEYTSS